MFPYTLSTLHGHAVLDSHYNEDRIGVNNNRRTVTVLPLVLAQKDRTTGMDEETGQVLAQQPVPASLVKADDFCYSN